MIASILIVFTLLSANLADYYADYDNGHRNSGYYDDYYGSGVKDVSNSHGSSSGIAGESTLYGRAKHRADFGLHGGLVAKGKFSAFGHQDQGSKFERITKFRRGTQTDRSGKQKNFNDFDESGKLREYGDQRFVARFGLNGDMDAVRRHKLYDHSKVLGNTDQYASQQGYSAPRNYYGANTGHPGSYSGYYGQYYGGSGNGRNSNEDESGVTDLQFGARNDNSQGSVPDNVGSVPGPNGGLTVAEERNGGRYGQSFGAYGGHIAPQPYGNGGGIVSEGPESGGFVNFGGWGNGFLTHSPYGGRYGGKTGSGVRYPPSKGYFNNRPLRSDNVNLRAPETQSPPGGYLYNRPLRSDNVNLRAPETQSPPGGYFDNRPLRSDNVNPGAPETESLPEKEDESHNNAEMGEKSENTKSLSKSLLNRIRMHSF